MKGVVFNVVEEVVVERFGDATWDRLLLDAGVDGAYTALGNYSDEQLVALVSAAAAVLDVDVPDVLRLVGRAGFSRLAQRYPDFEQHDSMLSVLRSLNSVIHPQVLNLYPGASVPTFALSEDADGLRLTYESERGLCHLAEGLTLGVADHFGETVAVEQSECRHRGDDCCIIRIERGHG